MRYDIFIVIFLFLHDILIPPAALPMEQQHEDRLATNFLSWVWNLPYYAQLSFAILTAGVLSCWSLPVLAAQKHTLWWFWTMIFTLAGWALRYWAKQILADFFTYKL